MVEVADDHDAERERELPQVLGGAQNIKIAAVSEIPLLRHVAPHVVLVFEAVNK